MWAFSTPIVYSTVGLYTVINSEILTKVISVTINNISNSLSLMSTSGNSTEMIRKYYEEVETLDIEIRLKLVNNWLHGVNTNKIKQNSSLDIIYRGISDACHKISKIIEIINNKINQYNTLWFKYWRSIQLEKEIISLKKISMILNERIALIPMSCMWEDANEIKYIETEMQEIEKDIIPGEEYTVL